MEKESNPSLITYYDARRLLMEVLVRAFHDLNLSDSFIRNEARQWLLDYGISLAVELNPNLPVEKVIERTNQIDRVTGIIQGVDRLHSIECFEMAGELHNLSQ